MRLFCLNKKKNNNIAFQDLHPHAAALVLLLVISGNVQPLQGVEDGRGHGGQVPVRHVRVCPVIHTRSNLHFAKKKKSLRPPTSH